MHTSLPQLDPGNEFDVVVIGAGGAGMSAALFAAIDGAEVLLVESTAYVGGTTALSAATTWAPLSQPGLAVNPDDRYERVLDFLDRAVGDRAPRDMRIAFLDNAQKAIAKLEAHSQVQYQVRPVHPDYLSELEASVRGGRAIEPKPFDGRLLGDALKLVRAPIPEFTVLGGMMVDRDDIAHLLGLSRSFKSFRYAVRIILRHMVDRMRYGRGTRLVMGNALVARLLRSLLDRKVSILTETALESLQRAEPDHDGTFVVGLSQNGTRRTIKARGGVILATGGFNRHPQKRAAMLPGADIAWCPGAPGHTGSAHDLALALGARYGATSLGKPAARATAPVQSHAFWAPVSIRTRADGSTAVFPHFIMDRGKPGMITLNQRGERFLNESTSYHLFGLAMQAANQVSPCVPAWLVCDAAALKRYGLGMIRPGAQPGKAIAPFLADGYLVQADTIGALAEKIGVDAIVLANSITTFNAAAEQGVDTAFHRGSTAYQRNNGDTTQPGKNPCLGKLETAPYFAIRLYPGDIGASTGLLTDTRARVLGHDDKPIPGLYAVGNDMQSIMGGTYPGPGITIGPGVTFAYLAAEDAIRRLRER